MGNGLVSVVIPTYNREKYVIDAVRSALRQTYYPLEVIVVDDGSKDGTADVLSQLVSEGRVRYIRKENGGPASARNLGIREARGEWVAFLDTDDRWEPWKTAVQVNVLRRYTEAGLVFTDFRATTGQREYESYLNEYFSVLRRLSLKYADVFENYSFDEFILDGEDSPRNIPVYWGNVFKTVFQGNFILTSTVMAKRDLLLSIGGMDETYRTGEDSDMYLRFTRFFPVAFIDIPASIYTTVPDDRLSGEAYSLPLLENSYRSMLKIAESTPEFCMKNKAMVRTRLGGKTHEIGRLLLDRGEKERAREMFRRSLRHDPINWMSAAGYLIALIPGEDPLGVLRRWKRRIFPKGNL